MNSSLSVVDIPTGTVLRQIPTNGYPLAVAALTKGTFADRKVYVSSEQRGVVDVVDVALGRTVGFIPTGTQASALLLNAAQTKLFVANTGSDTVSILNTATDKVEKTILLRPADARDLPGAAPQGMVLSPDEKTLFVALSDMAAVAVVDLEKNAVRGYIPVGWYPTGVAVSRDGKKLFVLNAKGVGVRNPNDKPVVVAGADRPQYIQNVIEGTVSTVDIANALADLPRHTAQTIANNRITRDPIRSAREALQNPGIEHVIYIIKENRTYDQVLGDLPQGNGDPSLVLFGRDVTPNQHALAERFVLLDNFYCCCARSPATAGTGPRQGMVE